MADQEPADLDNQPRRRPDTELHPAARIARLNTIDSTTWPDRIDRALHTLRAATSPLHATPTDTPTTRGTPGDPTAREAANPETHRATTTRNRLLRLLAEHDDRHSEIRRILDDWAPHQPRITHCHNHRDQLGELVVTPSRKRLCRFCAATLDELGILPTAPLLRQAGRGRNIAAGEKLRIMGVNPYTPARNQPTEPNPAVTPDLAATLEHIADLVNPTWETNTPDA